MARMEYRVKQLLKGKLVPAMLSIVLGIVIIIARRAVHNMYCSNALAPDATQIMNYHNYQG